MYIVLLVLFALVLHRAVTLLHQIHLNYYSHLLVCARHYQCGESRIMWYIYLIYITN